VKTRARVVLLCRLRDVFRVGWRNGILAGCWSSGARRSGTAPPAQRRGRTDPSHRHPGQEVRTLRLPADHGTVAERGGRWARFFLTSPFIGQAITLIDPDWVAAPLNECN
jgi:hypothetical protein